MATRTDQDRSSQYVGAGSNYENWNIIIGDVENEEQPAFSGSILNLAHILRMPLPRHYNINQVAQMAREEQARQASRGNRVPSADLAIRTALLRLAREGNGGGHGGGGQETIQAHDNESIDEFLATASDGLPHNTRRASQPSTTNYPQGHPLGPDPRDWKFDPKTQGLIDEYLKNFPPEENLPTDDFEHFCVCDGADDGRPMIECSNNHKNACLQGWFHLDCIGMEIEKIPADDGTDTLSGSIVDSVTDEPIEDWYCERCTTEQVGRLRQDAPKSRGPISTKTITERTKNVGVSATERSDSSAELRKSAKKKEMARKKANLRKSQKLKKLEVQTHAASLPNTVLPIVNTPKPWTAPLDRSLTNDAGFTADYNLNSLSDAKTALQMPAPAMDGDIYMSDNAKCKKRSPLAGRSGGKSWSKEEDQHLIDVVQELTNAGMCGENMWLSVQPMMEERGVRRTAAGMKMQWCRRLRIQVVTPALWCFQR